MYKYDKETIYVLQTASPFKLVKFVFIGDNG